MSKQATTNSLDAQGPEEGCRQTCTGVKMRKQAELAKEEQAKLSPVAESLQQCVTTTCRTVNSSDDESIHLAESIPEPSVAYERPRTSQNPTFKGISSSSETPRKLCDGKLWQRVRDPFGPELREEYARMEAARRWMRQARMKMTDVEARRRDIAEMKLHDVGSTTTEGRIVWDAYWSQLCTSQEEHLYKQIEDLKLSELMSVTMDPDVVPTSYSRLFDVVSALRKKEGVHISVIETVRDVRRKLVEHMDEHRTLCRMLDAKKWRGERLTARDFPAQMRFLVAVLDLVVQMNEHHYRMEGRELFRTWARPRAWNCEEEVRSRLVLLAKARVADSDKYLVKQVGGHDPADLFGRTNKT